MNAAITDVSPKGFTVDDPLETMAPQGGQGGIGQISLDCDTGTESFDFLKLIMIPIMADIAKRTIIIEKGPNKYVGCISAAGNILKCTRSINSTTDSNKTIKMMLWNRLQ